MILYGIRPISFPHVWEVCALKLAFIVYDDMTLLDFAGTYDPLTRIKTMGFGDDFAYDVCAFSDTVRSYEGLVVKPDKAGVALTEYDCILIPGGNGVGALIKDEPFLSWIRGVSQKATLAAVCGGTLVLGAAGFLKGKRATTHPALMPYLERFTDGAVPDRIVEDGRIVTARGVTSAIDLGLYLCEKFAGVQAREKIQKQMDYAAYPFPEQQGLLEQLVYRDIVLPAVRLDQ